MKQPGRGVAHPPSSSAEVKERLEITLTLATYKQPVDCNLGLSTDKQ
jgi:hypothetical protein